MIDREVQQLIAELQELDKLIGSAVTSDDLPVTALDTIINVARIADDAYENGDDPLFSDALYDAIRAHVRANATLAAIEYSDTVGSDVRGGKIALPNAMGSLTQAYDQGDLVAWAQKHRLPPETELIITEKEDGMSSSVHNGSTGEFRIAYSRGNGTEGADMSRHIKHIKSMPKKVTAGLEVRAEIIISNPNFEILKTKIFRSDGSVYKNPRNMISGLMNKSEIDPIAYQYIDAIVYHDWNETDESKEEQLKRFTKLGYQVPYWEKITVADLSDKFLTERLNHIRDTSKYLVDGIVIEVNDAKLRNRINPSKATLNPEYARKYKVADAANNAIATVDYVENRVSKHGYIIPRVHFHPIPLAGVTVTHATAHNYAYVIENGISPGAKVRITRSGDVIPYIIDVVEKGPYTDEDFDEQLQDVGEYTWTVNAKGQRVHAVLTGDHKNIGIKQAASFFEAIGVEGLKLGNVTRLCECGFDTIEKIVKASADELAFAIGSPSVADEIFTSIHKQLKLQTLPQFMGASGKFGRGMGKRKIQQVYDVFGDSLLDVTVDQLLPVDKFNVKTATKFVSGLPVYLEFYESIADYVEFVEKKVVEGGALNGQVFVFTGFRNKALEERITAAGGEVAASYSKKVTTLIAADPDERSTKLDKARKDRCKVIGLVDVDLLFEE
jgi:NAD-dependent DNA ligase